MIAMFTVCIFSIKNNYKPHYILIKIICHLIRVDDTSLSSFDFYRIIRPLFMIGLRSITTITTECHALRPYIYIFTLRINRPARLETE
jgi:hypothetical protein